MRGLISLAVALAAGIAWLLATWPPVARADTVDPVARPADAVEPTPTAAVATRRAATTERATSARAGARVYERPAPAALADAVTPGDPVGLALFGNVVDADGKPIENGTVIAERAGENAGPSGRLQGRGYRLIGLEPGAWKLSCMAHGFERFTRDLELAPAPRFTRIDVVLERKRELRVFAFAADGRPFASGLAEAQGRGELPHRIAVVGVATEAAPGPRLPWTRVEELDARTLGRWNDALESMRLPQEGGRGALPAGCLGWIELRRAPPFFASLVLGGAVLAAQRVEGGATDVRFQLDVAAVLRLRAAIRAQFVSAEDRRPLAGVRIAVLAHGWNGPRAATDADGRIAFARCLPGTVDLSAWDERFEFFTRRVVVEAATDLDLGTIQLARGVTLRGTITDANGKPVQLRVRVVDLARLQSSREVERATRHGSNAEGEFEVKMLCRGRHLLYAGDDESELAAWQVVDTTALGADRVSVVARPVTSLRLVGKDKEDRTWSVVLCAPDGTPLLARGLTAGGASQVRVLPGTYRIEVWNDRQLVRTETLSVGADGATFAVP